MENICSRVLIQASADAEHVTFRLYGRKPAWTVQVAPPVISDRLAADPTPVIQPEPTLPWGRSLPVESAREGEPADTRKALALLAAELGRSGSGTLAWTASELAWSRSEPPSERTAELARQVRSELAGRVNGHHA